MSRRFVAVLVFAAVLLTACSVALSRRDARDRDDGRSRRLVPFPWREAVGAVIARPDGSVVECVRDDDGGWNVKLPHGGVDALGSDAAEALAALAALAWREPLAGRAAPGPEGTAALTVADAAGRRVEIRFGDVRNNLRAAVVDGDPSVVYGVNQDLLDFLDWPAGRYRSMLLASAGGGRKPKKILLAPDGDGGGLEILMEQTPNGWRMAGPVAWPVDETRLDIVVRWLDRLRAEAVAAELSGDPGFFGFTPQSTRVEAWYDTPRGEIHRRVEFGGDAGDGRVYVRETGRNPVFTIPREAMAEISLDIATRHPVSWRNFYRQRLFDRLGTDAPAAVVVERLLPTPARLVITPGNDPADARWHGRLEEGATVRQFPVDAPDGRDRMLPLAALFTGLANLRVKNFLADVPPGPETAAWTAHPAWRFSVRSADGRELPGATLYAMDAMGNLPCGAPYAEGRAEPLELEAPPGLPGNAGLAFSVPDRAAVMETFGELAYLLCLPPYRYQSARLLSLDAGTWSRVEIRRADVSGEAGPPAVYTRDADDVNEQWWRAGDVPEPLMDDNHRFVGLLLELSQLRAEGFVQSGSGDLGKFGLDRPEITAIVYSSSAQAGSPAMDSRLFKLSLGGEVDAGGARYARLDDGGPVFLVSSAIAGRLGEDYR